MKRRLGRRVGARMSVTILAVVSMVVMPGPAGAGHGGAHYGVCNVVVPGQDPITIGVGGQPVATTPGTDDTQWCVDIYGDPTDSVTLQTRTYGGTSRAVFLETGQDGQMEAWVIVYVWEGSSPTQYGTNVLIPPSTSTCLVFTGNPSYNPGGCLLFLEQ